MKSRKKRKILEKIAKKEITAKEGYNLLYGEKAKPVRFANLKMKIKDEPGVSRLVNALFFFPLPVRWVSRMALRYGKIEDVPQELLELVFKYGGGTHIIVDTDDVKVAIELI